MSGLGLWLVACAAGEAKQCIVQGIGAGPCCTFASFDGSEREGACIDGACTDGREFDRENVACGGSGQQRDQGFVLLDAWVPPPDMSPAGGAGGAAGGAGGGAGGAGGGVGGAGGVGGDGGAGPGGSGGAGGGGGMGGGPGDPCVVAVCDPGQTCDPETGACQSRPAGPCTADVECQVGSCLDEPGSDGAVPGGFCSVPCAEDRECAGGHCLPNADANLCFADCGLATPCREGWTCLPVLDGEGNPTGPSRCLPDCRLPEVGCAAGQQCNAETGACEVGPEPCRYACQANESCEDARCVRANGTCVTDYHCELGARQCADGRCVVSEFTECGNAGQCDGTQTCFPFNDVPAGGLCLFSCDADEACPADRTCFTADRVCYWRICGAAAENGTVWGTCQAGSQNQWAGSCLPLPAPAPGDQQVGVCIEAGNVPEGGACDDQTTGRSPDDRALQCAAGLLCFDDPDDSLDPSRDWAGRGACRQMCDPRVGGCATAGRSCVDFSTLDDPATPADDGRYLGLCLQSDCTVAQDDCAAGQHCRPYSLVAEEGVCGPAGAAAFGAACTENADCGGLALCANAGAGPVCLQLCDPAQPVCAQGTACRQEAGWGFGVCL